MVIVETIWDVLRTIDDPEMPISIVDLGIVENVQIEESGEATERRSDGGSESEAACSSERVLGLVQIQIEILPTFVGCPALPMIEAEIRQKVGALPGVSGIAVRFVNDPPWTVDRISEPGREALRAHGVTVPERGGVCGPASTENQSHAPVVPLTLSGANAAVPCPFCESSATHLDSAFGPTRCRMIYYCEACKNSFEHLKRV